jgi:putative tryptophan/tyrosine transport system substrate-binding protein
MSIALPAETSAISWPRQTRTDELRRQLADDIVRGQLVPGAPLDEIELAMFGLRADQLADHAEKIVKAGVDVILCAGAAPIRAAQQATKTIPILGITDDMVGSRLVGSLAKPDGNTTGEHPCPRT